MKRVKSALLAAVLSAPLLPFAATAGTISVTGEATVQSEPDQATISFGVTTDGDTAALAMAKNNTALNAVIERLKSVGITSADLQTSSLSLSPNWVGYDGSSTPKIAGYMASNMLNVRLRDVSALGSVLDAAITDGANTLNGITFEMSDPKPLQDEARKAAMVDALQRATLLAEAAGMKLGKATAVVEMTNYNGPMPVFKSAADAAMAVPIATGQIGIMASITVTFDAE